MLVLKGKPVADHIYSEIKLKMVSVGARTPHLVVVLVGNDPASEVYVSHKQKGCESLGFKSTLIKLSVDATEAELEKTLRGLNEDSGVHGILLQLPLPKHLDAKKFTNMIAPEKDADGLTNASLGQLMAGQQLVAGCTPSGIIEMLKYYKLDVAGKNVLVVGRSLIVGLPMFHLLLQQNATVTVAHSQTSNLKELLKQFDFVVVAAGKAQFLKAQDFKKGAVVIDVGIHRTPAGLVGDVDAFGASDHLHALSPVPGGVGPMTIAMLMQNTFKLANAK